MLLFQAEDTSWQKAFRFWHIRKMKRLFSVNEVDWMRKVAADKVKEVIKGQIMQARVKN